MTPAPARLCVLALAVCALAGCGPKFVRERVFDKPGVRVELRHQVVEGAPVPRGYAQPATIADVRIAHILASLSTEDDKGERQPMIRSEFVYELADGIALALAKAGPDDEVAAASFPVDTRLGIFSDERVTAFRVVLVGDTLRLEVVDGDDISSLAFNRYWTRLCIRQEKSGPQIALRYKGREFAVGRHRDEEGKRALARALAFRLHC